MATIPLIIEKESAGYRDRSRQTEYTQTRHWEDSQLIA